MSQKSLAKGAARLPEVKRLHALINEIAKPKSVRGYELHFGDDATGDAAVWVYFLLEPDRRSSDDDIEELTDLRFRVSDSILKKGGLDRIPYVNFREIPSKAA